MENTNKEMIIKFVFGDKKPTEQEVMECLGIFEDFQKKLDEKDFVESKK
jgi:hypothetical protein